MRNMRKRLLSILFTFGCILNVYTQQISVSPIAHNDQLPTNSVRRVFQDKDGFLWFGTLDGLCRYDGYNIMTFRSDFNNPNLLMNNEITYLSEDKNSNLWIGTTKGINILDKKTYSVSVFKDTTIRNQEIRCIEAASDGTIWVGADNSVYRYNSDFSLLKNYNDILQISTSPNYIYEDTEENIWILLWGKGLHKYNKATDSFTKYPPIGESNVPFRIFQDNKKQYWVCTWGNGLFLFDPNKEESQMYTPMHIFNKERKINETTFFSIAQDDTYNYVWAMSLSGLYAFEYQPDGTLKNVDISPLFKSYNNIFSEIIKDNIGNLWIGTFSEGVLNVCFHKPIIQNHNLSLIKSKTGITPNITAIHCDQDGDLWFNQNRWGIGLFNPVENDILFYNDIKAFPSILENTDRGASCISGFRSVPDEIWIGIESQPLIYRMEKKNKSTFLKEIVDLSAISSNPGFIQVMFEDRKNNIWLASANQLFIKFSNKDSIEAIHNFPITGIIGIAEDTKGDIWIITKDNGVYQSSFSKDMDIRKYQWVNYNQKSHSSLSSNISSICADKHGRVWVGTTEGSVVAYDVIVQEFTDHTQKIKLTGESILNIIDDDYGNLWISTNKQIIAYNPQNETSRTYTHVDGVAVNSFLKNACFKDKNGKIYFGGNNGISVFNPSQKAAESKSLNKTQITNVKVNGNSVFHKNENDKFDVISPQLTLDADDKNIEIHFSSLNYIFPTKIRYAYKMDRVDADWIYPEGNRQFAIYNKLDKGTHTFHIKATDENQLWSSNITVMKIYKHPALYETWYAFMIYIVLTFSLIYYIYVKAKNRMKLLNDLKIAQIEKNKSEELTQTKLRYFTNISHDFLTPLTIISCLIDDAEITYNGKIRQFDAIRLNLSRLRRLIQQVLDFRKVESGNMKLKITQGDIAGFVKDICYNHFLVLMKKKNIHFLFSASQNHIQAYFDADKIDKIVFNLLSNAFKYTPENGKVKIELERFSKEDKTFLRLTVNDTGIGISESKIDDIFIRFYNNNIKEAEETNGIGLSLTKELIEIHHGSIKVESIKDKGTSFIVEIPINRDSYSDLVLGISEQNMSQEKNMELMEIPEETEYEENDRDQNNSISILLVEDNQELLVLVKNILSKHYNIITAINGVDALNKLKENNIDIIISDVMMPELDGLDLCRIIKNDLETSHIPIILLTAKSSTEDRIDCYNAGADAYISKPFELKILEARIKNFLSNKQQKQKEFKSDQEINISKLEYPSLDKQFLSNTIKIIEENLALEDFDTIVLADKLSVSKSTLYRKIKSMTALSPRDFIRNIRLKHACMMLKDKSINISEVAYAVGFSDPKYFTACFRQEFNITPRDYQKQQASLLS